MDGNGSSKGIAISPRDPSTFSEGTWTLQTYISAPNHLLRSLESLGWGFIHVHSPHSQWIAAQSGEGYHSFRWVFPPIYETITYGMVHPVSTRSIEHGCEGHIP